MKIRAYVTLLMSVSMLESCERASSHSNLPPPSQTPLPAGATGDDSNAAPPAEPANQPNPSDPVTDEPTPTPQATPSPTLPPADAPAPQRPVLFSASEGIVSHGEAFAVKVAWTNTPRRGANNAFQVQFASSTFHAIRPVSGLKVTLWVVGRGEVGSRRGVEIASLGGNSFLVSNVNFPFEEQWQVRIQATSEGVVDSVDVPITVE